MDDADGGDGEEGEDEHAIEHIHVDERFSYLEHVIRFMAVLHSLISLFMLVAYYHLKGSVFLYCIRFMSVLTLFFVI